MSEEFVKLARKEIQEHLDSLEYILLGCPSDKKIYEKSEQVEKHLHSIKGLAPMIGEDSVGDFAHLSDIILKYIIKNGKLNGSQKVIASAIQKMNDAFSGHVNFDATEFKKLLRDTFPQIPGL